MKTKHLIIDNLRFQILQNFVIQKLCKKMEALLVQVKDKTELKLISDLLKKMQIETQLLSEEQREDLGLIKLMKQADRTEKVSREKVMAKLVRK